VEFCACSSFELNFTMPRKSADEGVVYISLYIGHLRVFNI
jgi:hypothetical protein